MKHLIIIGVGGFAREVCHSAKESVGYGEDWDIKGFLNGDVRLPDEEYNKLALPVLGDVNDYKIQKDDVFICAVGNPNVKFKLIQLILNHGGEFINLLHRTTRISVTAKMGVGNIFVPYTGLKEILINPFCPFRIFFRYTASKCLRRSVATPSAIFPCTTKKSLENA